jgi:glycosyltransferase involved in cell wall biosynthesis
LANAATLKLAYFCYVFYGAATLVAQFCSATVIWMEDAIKYSVVIPVFRAKDYMQASVLRVMRTMDAIGLPYEIILADDHSTDGTWEVLKSIKAQYAQVRIAQLSTNIGQTPATYLGATLANGDLIITLDDDLQHPPEEIPNLIAAFEANDVDIVFGDPEQRQHPNRQHPFLVAVGKFMFHRVFLRQYRKLNFFTTFRLFKRGLLSVNGGPWSHLFFIWQLSPNRAMHTPTKHEPRKQGASNHTALRLIRHFSPFLWYFALRTAVVLQVLLLLGALAYYGYQYQGEDLDLSNGYWILAFAVIVFVAKQAVFAKLRKLENLNSTITEG